MKFIYVLLILNMLAGCTTINPSSLSDMKLPANYNAEGKKIFLIYEGKKDDRLADADKGAVSLSDNEKSQRIFEISQLLRNKGFDVVQSKENAYTLKIWEGSLIGLDDSNTGYLSAYIHVLSLTTIPALSVEKMNIQYTVYAANNKMITQFTNKNKVQFSSHGVSGVKYGLSENKRSEARLKSHEQALAEFVEQ